MLEPGQQIAHYRIGKQLGAGGMGEVWEAEDTRLGRRVALKVLSPELADSPEQLERLRREARALARLQHPGIVTVHAFEEVEGVRFVAMELVEGERLSRRIARGPIQLKEFFRLAIPLVDTIAAAHAQGVIHRDLKPGNIMVDERQRIKVLDFGLAKRFYADGDGSDRTEALTQDGRLLGTLPYMSPEQIQGREPDARSDIFATGLVLYELLTGQYPFNKESQADLISSILRDEPVPLTEARPELPRQLGTIVRRCLEKGPEQRFQTAIDLRNALEDLDEDLTSDEILERSRVLTDVRRPDRRRRALQLLAAGAAAIAVLLAWRLVPPRGEEGPQPVTTPVVTWPSSEWSSRLSPDGAWVSFLSDRTHQRTVWIQDLAGGRARRLIDHEGEIWSHAWAPDSRRLAVLVRLPDERLLQTLSAGGGPIETSLALDPEFADAKLVRWLGEGELYLEVPRRGLVRLDLASGSSRPLIAASAGPGGRRDQFDVDPAGRRVLFRLLESGRSSVWSARIDGDGAARRSAEGFDAVTPHWLGDDRDSFVFASNRSGESDLWLARLGRDDAQRLVSSADEQLIDDVADDGSVLSFSRAHVASDLWAIDPDGRDRRQLTADTLRDFWPSGFPGAPLVAFQRSKPSFGSLPSLFSGQLLVGRLEDGRLANEEPVVADGFLPVLAPDLESLAFARRGGDRSFELWRIHLGTGHSTLVYRAFRAPRLQMEQLDPVDQHVVWSPDARALYFVGLDDRQRQRLYRHTLAGAETLALSDGGDGDFLSDLFLSADGRRLAWIRTLGDRRRSEVRVLDLETAAEGAVFTAEHAVGEALHLRGWLAGGKALLVLGSRANPDWSHELDLLEVAPEGGSRRLGSLSRALIGTARLLADRGTLYVTLLAGEPQVHNLFAVALGSGEVTQLTDNGMTGIRYSAIAAGGDVLVFTRHVHNSDVYTVSLGR